MKVVQYLKMLEKHADRLGSVHLASGIGAKGLATACSISNLNEEKCQAAPYPIQWQVLEEAMASDAYQKDILEFCKKFTNDLSEDSIRKGVKSLLSQKSFAIPIEFGATTYGLTVKPNTETKLRKIKEAMIKAKDEEGLKLFEFALRSDDAMRVIGSLATLNDANILLDGYISVIAEMDYLDFLKLAEISVVLSNKIYAMDWKNLLKN